MGMIDEERNVAAESNFSSLEEALLKRLSCDDPDLAEEALSQVYERHAAAVHLFAAGALQDEPLARLVVEDIFVDLYRWGSVDLGRESLRAYLIKQAHRRCVELAVKVIGSREDRATVPAAGDERGVAGAATAVCVVALPPEERVVIDLTHLGRMTYAEVATFLNLSEHTVKARLRDGLRRLPSQL